MGEGGGGGGAAGWYNNLQAQGFHLTHLSVMREES